jgi:hypothetical protein
MFYYIFDLYFNKESRYEKHVREYRSSPSYRQPD